MNPWISSGLATMVEFWDAGMCCWPVWDHIWIVWLFDSSVVFSFFLWPGNFNQLVVFWQVNASGKGVVCDFNSGVLQYHPASMESIDHRLTGHEKNHWGQSAGWLSGLALWPGPGVMVWFQVRFESCCFFFMILLMENSEIHCTKGVLPLQWNGLYWHQSRCSWHVSDAQSRWLRLRLSCVWDVFKVRRK